MTYRERRLAKADRLRDWADKRAEKSANAFESARAIADNIPLGQPILVGHHSEKRHRRDIARIDNGMRKGIEHENKARDMSSRADNIEAAADSAIYSDDPDALDALTAKLACLEAERERVKAVNKMIRAKGLEACASELTAAEMASLMSVVRHQAYYHAETRGYPPYHSSNLSGNISRLRKRIAGMSGQPAIAAKVAASGDTATARAGLKVHATMTTPSRPGKQPRPVWNVGGNLAFWRPLLTDLGGTWYRGVFSFWDDPSAAIETACAEAESRDAERGISIEVPAYPFNCLT
jgi:hypothetical protein